MIYVFKRGRIIEFGMHDELMQRMGAYFGFINLQNLSRARVLYGGNWLGREGVCTLGAVGGFRK